MKLGFITMVFLSLLGVAYPALAPSLRSAGVTQGTIDYMTEEEADQVRAAQPIDLRVKVLMKIAERRLMVAENPEVKPAKNEAEWGALPKGSRADMLRQYNRAIEETITNFEEAYDRNPKDERMLKALTTFTQQTALHAQRLEALRSSINDEATRQLLEQVLDDLKLAVDDARQSEEQYKQEKLQQEQQKKEQKKEKKKKN